MPLNDILQNSIYRFIMPYNAIIVDETRGGLLHFTYANKKRGNDNQYMLANGDTVTDVKLRVTYDFVGRPKKFGLFLVKIGDKQYVDVDNVDLSKDKYPSLKIIPTNLRRQYVHEHTKALERKKMKESAMVAGFMFLVGLFILIGGVMIKFGVEDLVGSISQLTNALSHYSSVLSSLEGGATP